MAGLAALLLASSVVACGASSPVSAPATWPPTAATPAAATSAPRRSSATVTAEHEVNPGLRQGLRTGWRRGRTINAFAHRHDRHVVKHHVIATVEALMNVVMLLAVLYQAFVGTNAGKQDAVIALAIVGGWIIIGVARVALNPYKRGDKLIDSSAPRKELVLTV